uniref:Leucine rich repeat containing 3Cb n=1 Tax=Oryzias melastigma TaxID=30732 RepID=A0A3B3DYD4_ORYME
MASSLPGVTAWSGGTSSASNKDCVQVETGSGGLTVRCSGLRLTQVPLGLSNRTFFLLLNRNLLRSLPPKSFSGLLQLHELDLSNNQLSTLEPGCFYGLEDSLRLLDLSSNRLSWLEPQAFAGLQVQVNFTHNPWHCDCSMQVSPTCAGEGARAAHMLMTSYLDADVRVSDGSGSIFSRESGVPDIRHPKRWNRRPPAGLTGGGLGPVPVCEENHGCADSDHHVPLVLHARLLPDLLRPSERGVC